MSYKDYDVEISPKSSSVNYIDRLKIDTFSGYL